MSLSLSTWKEWYTQNRDQIFSDFFTFLRFKTIATDPGFADECPRCADWLKEYLNEIGMEATLWETSGMPVVFAEHCEAGNDRPTLLIYHHYDVQPVDPLDLWDSDPFEPEIREGAVYARGAQDNKGQCFYTLAALKLFLLHCNEASFNIKVFIEGEEESGSNGTEEVFTTHAEDLKSDYLLVIDSGLHEANSPAISLGMRGIVTAEVCVQGSDMDLHSGGYGGIVLNPLRALSKTLATLWDEEGRVTIRGFYDDVVELSPEERKEYDLQLDEERVVKEAGLRVTAPEPGYSISESVSIRPTVEINGMSGGYTGEGFKTVIPAKAKAKISCRLVSNQDPEKIARSLSAHLVEHTPKGMDITVEIDQGAKAFLSSGQSTIAKVAAKAYEEVLGKPCQKILMGGSVPIVKPLAEVSGAETIAMGYGLDSDLIHSPNEHFGTVRFEQGFLTMGRILSLLHERT